MEEFGVSMLFLSVIVKKFFDINLSNYLVYHGFDFIFMKRDDFILQFYKLFSSMVYFLCQGF
jgi:hypothetical protein